MSGRVLIIIRILPHHANLRLLFQRFPLLIGGVRLCVDVGHAVAVAVPAHVGVGGALRLRRGLRLGRALRV